MWGFFIAHGRVRNSCFGKGIAANPASGQTGQRAFFLGEINKRDLVLTKLACALGQPREQSSAVACLQRPHTLRLLNVVKLSVVANADSLKMFWDALMEGTPNRAQSRFVDCLRGMTPRLPQISDARSRQIIGDAIEWAIASIKT